MAAPPAQLRLALAGVFPSARWPAALLRAERTDQRRTSDRALLDERRVHGDTPLLLHAWDADDHVNLVEPDRAARARSLGAAVVGEQHVNPAPQHRELWLRGPDGCIVVRCSPDGEAAPPAAAG